MLCASLNWRGSSIKSKQEITVTKTIKLFSCADVGYTDCAWELKGHSVEEMIPEIEAHAVDVHHLNLKDEAIEHVRRAIHEVAV